MPTRHLALILLGLLLAVPGRASVDLDSQRKQFRSAEQALERDDLDSFRRLRGQLENYPIAAYLDLDAFRKGLKQASPGEVRTFLDRHADFPFRYRLLGEWLDVLAKRKDWTNYLSFYDGRKDGLQECRYLLARLRTGQTDGLMDAVRKRWLSGYSQPDDCDDPFAWFLGRSRDRDALLWLRIEKAFKARRPSLARYLSKKFENPAEKVKVERWVRAHRQPEQALKELQGLPDNRLNRKMILHALDRLARRDSEKALEYWEPLRNRRKFDSDQRGRIDRRIALSAALQHRPAAKELLQQLPDKLKTDTVHLWLARINLRDEDWIGLIRSIRAMPQRLADEAEWVYWLARAYDEAGKQGKARELFERLAKRGSYYGFLAADRVGRDYAIQQQPIAGDQPVDERKLLDANPNLLRARELFFVDRRDDARREWFQGLRKLDQKQIRMAASIASRWKWYDNAIKTVARTPHRKDYNLRFPMPFRQQVLANAREQGLDLSIVYGLMRRESLFDPLARSRVGALGLMQLMPATARHVAKTLGWSNPGTDDILEVDNNIRLGTSYFRSVLDRFDANVPLAAAAYNAGPRNVKRWLPEEQSLPADLWIETVPYKETRNYVQAVLAYATIFDKHLKQPVRISSRMADVQPDYESSKP